MSAIRVDDPAQAQAPDPRGALRLAGRLLIGTGTALALGGLTSLAQTVLPDALRPFANSASSWTLLTALIVWRSRVTPVPAAVLGALGFVALVLGYQIVSTLRGFPTSEELFLVAAIAVGPFVGAAAAWLRRTDLRCAIGCAALAGIALGESAYGLILLRQQTGWFAWTAIGVAGIALVGWVVLRRLRSRRDRPLAVVLSAAVALGFLAAYAGIGGLAV